MTLSRYHTFFSILLLLVSGIAAIVYQQPLLLVIPFAWLLVPSVFNYAVTQTGQWFWLLLIVFPLSTELNITPALGIDFPDEILLMLITGMVILKWIHQPGLFAYICNRPLFFILVMHLIWIAVTCVYAAEPLLAGKFLLAKLWYIVPLAMLPSLLLRTQTDWKKLALCLLVPMLLVVIITLVRHSFYGFSFEHVKNTMAPFFRNHVNYSAMLVCLLPVAWCMYTLTAKDNKKRWWLLYSMLIGLTALVFAYSRGAWLALIAGLCVAWVMRKGWMLSLVLILITAMVISCTWLVTDKNFMRFAPDHDRTVFHTNFGEHMLATVELKDVSNAERLYRWVAGARMFADRPVTGFGPNSFYLHYRPYAIKPFETWVSDNPEHSTVHNYFLLTLLEQGIVGLALFCALYFGMLYQVQLLYHRLNNQFYRSIALAMGSILAMIGVINFMSDMIETDKIGSLFWLCLGGIFVLHQQAAKASPAH